MDLLPPGGTLDEAAPEPKAHLEIRQGNDITRVGLVRRNGSQLQWLTFTP